MNKTKFLQSDGRWGGLPYPKKPCYIRAVGCGEVSIANVLIEMEQYKKYTPATIQPYCKRYGAPNCDGTYLSGICAMMKHYGLTDVKECDTMPQLWKELEKGNRVAIYLMGSRPGGSKKVHWTNGGHFVASVSYKYEDKKHKVYVKDPWTDAKNRNGWLSYEEHMKGDVVAVYVGKLVGEKATTPTTKSGKLTVDGIGGTATIKAMQKFFKVEQDGYIGDQIKKLNVYYPSITAVKYGKGKSGSQTVKALQKWLGLTKDGVIGKGTTAAWQHKLRDLGYLAKGEKIDGLFGVKSMKAWQKFLNDQLYGEGDKKPSSETPKEEAPKEEKPKADPLQPWFDAMTKQFKWSKGQKYKFNDHPNVTNSKEEGTCITFPSVSLQRLKLLPKNKYFYMNPKTNRIAGNGAAYVLEHTEIYKVSYPNKTVKQLWKEGKIKVGDIVGYDDPAYHTMVFMGFNSKGEPIYNTMGHKKGLKVTYPAYAKRKVNMLVRLKKVVK